MSQNQYKYDHPEGFDPERSGYPWSIDRQLLALIPPDSRIVELGCATGYMGRYLKEKHGCRMVGVEGDAASAEKARPFYESIHIGDLNQPQTYAPLTGPFDLVLAAAVLEHLQDPAGVLKRVAATLKPGGFVLLSLPNIAHWSVRWALARGRFDYSDYGILDRTHLRFFTYKTVDHLVKDAGLRVLDKGFDADAGIPFLQGLVRRLPGGWSLLRALYNRLPNLFAYQIWVKAVHQTAGGAVAGRVEAGRA